MISPALPARTRAILPVLLVYAGLFAFFLSIHLSTSHLACTDVFFHLKFAKLIGERGFIRDFPWMQFSIFRDHWVDQHFLFHLLLVPFAWVGNLITGAKLAATAYAALALTAFFVFLQRRKVPYPFFWLILLLGASFAFLYRMNMVRGMSVAVVLFLVYLDALLERRTKTAFAVGFLFVWTYQLFPLLIPLSLSVVLADLYERRRPFLRTPVAGILGICAGLVVNPFFPHDLVFLYQHAVIKVLNRANLGVGGEWMPFDSWFVVMGSLPVYVVLAGVALLLLMRPKRLHPTTVAMAFVAAVFFFMHMRSRRFIEYWPLFALLFAALAFRDLAPWEAWRKSRWQKPLLIAALLGFSLLAARNHRYAVLDIASNLPPERYREAALWLKDHSEPGEVVFTTDWDDFAELFFYNHENNYLVGLDPTFMLLDDPTLFYTWDQVSNGQLGHAASTIRRDFRSRFAFTDLAHKTFMDRADEDPAMRRVFLDGNAAIYEILPEYQETSFRVEAETGFPPAASSGAPSRVQNLKEEFGVACSNDRLLFGRTAEPGDFLEMEFRIPVEGRYAIAVGFVMAPDYGLLAIALDGETLGTSFDGFAPRIQPSEPYPLGTLDLTAGAHRIRFSVAGKNPESGGHFIGIDFLDLERIPAP